MEKTRGTAADQRKIKVIFGITKATWGGAQVYLWRLLAELPRDQFEPILVYGEAGALSSRMKDANIRTYPLRGMKREIGWWQELKHCWQLFRIFHNEAPDVLHLNSTKMMGLGAVAGRFAGVPQIIITIHGWVFMEKRLPLVRALQWLITWFNLAWVDRVIVITNQDYALAMKFPLIDKSKFSLVPIGIDKDISRAIPKEQARAALRKLFHDSGSFPASLNESVWIGTVAELTENKNLETLIRAHAHRGDRNPLIIIGEGRLRDRLRILIRKLGATDRILLAGSIPEAHTLVSAFDIFVLPSYKEGLPYALLEAGLAGCALIGSGVGGIPDIITHNETGLIFHPDNYQELASALETLTNDFTLRYRFATRQKRRIEESFREADMLRATYALYRT